MAVYTPNTITTVSRLFADLEQIRRRGYAIDEEEQELGVRCFAMAVPGAPTPMAISISGPVTRVTEAFAERAIPELRNAVHQLSSSLAVRVD